MRFNIDTKHRDFFLARHFLELEGVISADKASKFQQEIDLQLAARSTQMIENRPPSDLFLYGRNLNETLSSDRQLARLMGDLTGSKTVRFAYSQVIRTTIIPGPIFPHPSTIESVSCFQSLVGGILIRLLPDPHPPEFLPKAVGNALFFSPKCVIPWAELTQTPHQSFFLIAYGSKRTVYVLQKNDPHTHLMKKEGLAFGDTLKTPMLVG